MKKQEHKLILDLYKHYKSVTEITADEISLLYSKHGNIRNILKSLIQEFEPNTEVTEEYLDEKLKNYSIHEEEDTVIKVNDQKDSSIKFNSKNKSSNNSFKKILVIVIGIGIIFLLVKLNNIINAPNPTWCDCDKAVGEAIEYSLFQGREGSSAKYDKNIVTACAEKAIQLTQLKIEPKEMDISYLAQIAYEICKHGYYEGKYSDDRGKKYYPKEDEEVPTESNQNSVDSGENKDVESIDNSSEINSPETPTQDYNKAVVIIPKTHFYETPSYEKKRKGFLLEGDTIDITNEENGFLYASFTNSNGKTTSGWIVKSDVEFIEEPK